MEDVHYHEETPSGNPIDLIEGLVVAKEWPHDRRGPLEMAVDVPGRWCDYSLYFAWSEEMHALHFTCAFDMRVPSAKRRPVNDLLATINEKLWVGCFGIWDDEGLPLFRHTMLMRGVPGGVSSEQMEDLVDIALAECDRFYPAFQFVIWGGKTASEAVAAAMVETVGEA